nr:bifunctional diguanylate cyclase/phosphodiesterase [Butyrivibrio sp.]
HLLHWENGKRFFYVLIVDVDQNKFFNNTRNSYAEAEILSQNKDTDSLTGLFNMSFFYQKVQMLLSSFEIRRQEISFIHFDIPNFKIYNEQHGFKLGDDLLCYLAKTIKNRFPEGTVSRFSDDHFVVCELGDHDDVIKKVDGVYKDMLLAKDTNMRVRIKAGIYFLDDKLAEVGLACDHARLACNSIKNRHDINYFVYDEYLREKMRKQQYVVDNIYNAVKNGYIKVFYQPVIRVETGKICGYEALVRWIDPEIGFLSPADFIDTLEQFHLIHFVDKYVANQVCEDYVKLWEAGESLVPVSINISRLDFELCDIFGYIDSVREVNNVPVNMLDLEITESALDDNVGFIKSECDRMREMGYHIWIDDFGSGYSSLNTIAEYEFDVLKMDMVFLKNYGKNPKTGTLMSYIIKGAKEMGLSPLCEGVETQEQFDFLKSVGCERVQGYYFGKPMPLEESRAYTREKGLDWE